MYALYYAVAIVGYGSAISVLIGISRRVSQAYRRNKLKSRVRSIIKIDDCRELSAATIAKDRLKAIKVKDQRDIAVESKKHIRSVPVINHIDSVVTRIMKHQSTVVLEFSFNTVVKKILRVNRLKGDFINDYE
jgi:hypothetical protein